MIFEKKDLNPNFNSAWNFGLRNFVEQLEFFHKIGLTTSTFLVENTSHVTGGFFFSGKTRVVFPGDFTDLGRFVYACLPRDWRGGWRFFCCRIGTVELVDGNKPPG